MSNLREAAIQLAYDNPGAIQDALLPLLENGGGKVAKRMSRLEAKAWVDAKLKSMDHRQIPNDKTMALTMRDLKSLVSDRVKFNTDKAKEYEELYREFLGEGMRGHSENAYKLSQGFWVSAKGWGEIEVSNQFGELHLALLKARTLLR